MIFSVSANTKPQISVLVLKVYCEMRQTDGWIVIQRRSGGVVSFDRGWAQYRHGFGSLTYDHWLGLEKMRMLTKDTTKVWTLRVDLWDHGGGHAFAEYRDFRIGDEGTAYRLHVGTYSGDAGDAIRVAYPGIDQNGTGFSAFDRDNCSPCIQGDIAFDSCTDNHGSGWWYSSCGESKSKEQVLTGWAVGFKLTLFWKGKVLQFICKTNG
uniref:Fibrinogen C-terminal domain-containing protein n=1 Tax=Poecilia latipinna TaxID=48699 RepID=A0A3B3VL54_9TELE